MRVPLAALILRLARSAGTGSHLDVGRVARGNCVDGASRVHSNSAFESSPLSGAKKTWDRLYVIALATDSDKVILHCIANIEVV